MCCTDWNKSELMYVKQPHLQLAHCTFLLPHQASPPPLKKTQNTQIFDSTLAGNHDSRKATLVYGLQLIWNDWV